MPNPFRLLDQRIVATFFVMTFSLSSAAYAQSTTTQSTTTPPTTPPPTTIAGTCSPSPNVASTGQQVTWQAFPTGGSGSYTYQWSIYNSDVTFIGPNMVQNLLVSYSLAGTKNAVAVINYGTPEQLAIPCSPLTIIGVDTQAPTAPTNIRSTVTKYEVNLSWDPSIDNVGVTGYKVYRFNKLYGYKELVGNTSLNTFPITGLDPGTLLSLYISAYDAKGNTSPESAYSVSTLPSTYAIGTRVKVTVDSPVELKPAISSKKDGFQPAGAKGTIKDGPKVIKGNPWWYVDFDSGPDGWMLQSSYLVDTLALRLSPAWQTLSISDYLDQLAHNVGIIMANIQAIKVFSRASAGEAY